VSLIESINSEILSKSLFRLLEEEKYLGHQIPKAFNFTYVRKRCYQMASEEEKSPNFCPKMPYSCHRLLHGFIKCYFSQNLTLKLSFSYLHLFLNIVLCKKLEGSIFLAFFPFPKRNVIID